MAVVRQDVVQMSFDIDMKELTQLSDSLDEIKKTVTGDLGGNAFDEMISDTKKAADGVDDIKDSIKGVKPDGITDTAKGLDDTKKNAEGAHEKLKKIGNTSFDKTVSGLKKIVGTLGTIAVKAGKVLAKGLVAGVAGVGAIVTKSVMSYADYEQLVGGVETLFKDNAGTVQKYADNAYKTAGLSANEYMDTVTSFSASLISSLKGDTAQAAEYANMAITDMADNANKMGTDMSSIQDAYQGFAKQNYTMLDNLKLGYGGTQSEMKRLLKDAEKIQKSQGKNVKYSIKNFDDIVEAIHVVQENMGITGTTAEEADKTISGSLSSMKAAWNNALTSLIVGGDSFDDCVDNLVDSAKTFGKNIMPAIEKALSGVGKLIEELAPIIEAELPTIIDTLLPPLLQAATSLIKGLIVALPSIISTLAEELPDILMQVWDAIKDAFGDIPGMSKVEKFFTKLKTFCEENTGTIKGIIAALIGLVGALKLFSKIKGIAGIFGGSGKSGGGIFNVFTNLADLKTGTVLKGIANLAIIVGGLALLAAALMAVSPYMAQLSDLQSVGKVLLVIAAVGLIGTGLSKLAEYVGNIPVATVIKGLANIAISMVGFGVLSAVLMAVAPLMAQLCDMQTLVKTLIIISVVGIVGSALAGLAGLIGTIPIATVLTGLANIALALGGFTAVVSAFGALSQIDGFNEFITSGGEVLTNLCNILGEMVGSIIGGIGEGITNSLPTIGTNLSNFATNVQPLFTTLSGVDTEGLKNFAGAFATFIGVMAGEKLLSIITGGINYAELGTNLSTFATNISGFFSTIATFDENGFAKATALFNCLANISSLPKEGGVVGWFQGEVNYANMAAGLNQLASASGFFTTVAAIPEAAFTAATNLFNCLAGVKSLPKDGGIAQWFTGTIAFESLAAGLQTLTSESMIAAFTAIAGIPATAYTGLTSLFDALAGVKALPSEGGLFGWFTGDKSQGLSNVASQLPGVAANIATFFSNIGGRTDFSPIKNLFDTLGNIELASDVANGTGLFGMGASQLESMGTGLSNFATNASGFFSAINSFDVEKMKSFFAELATVGELPASLSTLDTTIGTTLSSMITTVETKMTEMKTAVVTGITGAIAVLITSYTSFYNAGVYMMQGLNSGIESMRSTLESTASSIASSIKNTIDDAMDINSPSKVTFESGTYIGEGLALGMQNAIKGVQLAANDLSLASMPYSSYTPESSSTTYNNGGNSEYTTVSPVFNLTVSGTQDDRATARKVKQWVAQAIQETFESLERKTPVLREV